MCICKFLRHLILENYKRRRRGGRGGVERGGRGGKEGVGRGGKEGVEGGGKEGILRSKFKPTGNFLFGEKELPYCHC